jgi:cytochrome c553
MVGGTLGVFGLIFLVSATQVEGGGQPTLPAKPAPAGDAPVMATAPSSVEGGGIALRSVCVKFPPSDITFPGSRQADEINSQCLLCHSAGMVLNQPDLSRADWQEVVKKMHQVFKAPFTAADAPAIVDYLVNLQAGKLQPPGRPADLEHGAVIAAQGTAAGAPACAKCHAFNGVSDASGAFPRIANQSAYYLAQQLRDFASGVRTNALMSPVAGGLSADDIADVAAYYAGVEAPFLPLKAPDPTLVKLGEKLATAGDARRQIQSCHNCHGPGGVGEMPAIPYLGNQYSHYITFTLLEWHHGFRKSSANTMAVVAQKLDDQEIAAVAAYYQQVYSQLEKAKPGAMNEKNSVRPATEGAK